MGTLFRLFCCWLLRLFISLRYRVQIKGLEKLRGLKGATLVLPNHPAFVDPMILFAHLWPWLRPRPMVYESNFHNPLMWPIISLIDAVPVPDMERASAQARDKAKGAVSTVIEGLQQGRNHILWPSGRLMRTHRETLGGVRALTEILKGVSEANIVLVRTCGLYGSRFSYAYTGEAPGMISGFLLGIWYLLLNLLVLMPRRAVDITVEILDRNELPELTRDKVNPWFEAWYNKELPTTPTFVPYHFLFGRRTYQFPKPGGLKATDLEKVTPETRKAVNHLLEEKLHRPLQDSENEAETTLDQLGLDSLDRMDLTLTVESHFGFTGDEVPQNLGQLWLLAQGLAKKGPLKPPPALWFRPPSDLRPLEIHGESLGEAFIHRALEIPREIACADDLAGALPYERLLVGAITLSHRFRELPGKNVGLLLPASVGCDVAFFALHLAGKLPIILNWTTGPANLEHAVNLMEVKHIVTSKAFLNRLSIEIPSVDYVYLEDIRKHTSIFEMIDTLLRVRLFPRSIRKLIPKVDPNDPAVVLFTSGSERNPKAVPLTHHNLLSNHRAAITFFGMTRSDSVLAFLPAFHSFGLSITGVLPIITGMRAVRHPDPTDATSLLRKIALYKPTCLVGTPTFINYILDRAKKGQLDSLRLVVVGAEKCPEALFQRCKELAPNSVLLEGYGITECSPVVSANPPQANRPGTIGIPLPGIEVRVVDLETKTPLPTGKTGMLWVHGPNIFPGYIGFEGPSPFQEQDGKRWYVTGDLASIDAEGYIHFSGRLKRFLKAGGEMVSLPALEEPFGNLFPPTDKGPRIAVEGIETETGRRIHLTLFCTEPFTLAEANRLLSGNGFTGVMRLDEVRQVPAIPVLGTGKTDYKVLRKMLQDT